MDEQQREESILDFTRPWAERRGLESMESHVGSILVKASVDELAEALAGIAIESKRNVLGSEIESSGCFVLTYQLVGQKWSAVLPDLIFDSEQLERCSRPSEAQLSALLGKPVIHIFVSDTAGYIGYKLFDNGEIIEYFSGSEESQFQDDNEYGLQTQRLEWMPYPEDDLEDDLEDDPGVIQTAYFWSQYRQINAEDIGNIWQFVDDFLRDHDAYDPAIDCRYFLGDWAPKRGVRYHIDNPGSTLNLGYSHSRQREEVTAVPDFLRIDYFRFGN
ncbi:MAG: hypothetical protein F6K19_49885 [Cyanothece sp. SIO1E1]|nr:hypothetical protein [Cyanothece sp. SIO1E1]